MGKVLLFPDADDFLAFMDQLQESYNRELDDGHDGDSTDN